MISKAALLIIGEEALKTIAQAQNCTRDEVMEAIGSGNEVACSQFKRLTRIGLEAVVLAGKI